MKYILANTRLLNAIQLSSVSSDDQVNSLWSKFIRHLVEFRTLYQNGFSAGLITENQAELCAKFLFECVFECSRIIDACIAQKLLDPTAEIRVDTSSIEKLAAKFKKSVRLPLATV